MIDLKTLIQEISVDPKSLNLKICFRNKQKEKTPDEFFPVFNGITGRFGMLFAGDMILVPEDLKRQVVDALRFERPGSTKMLAETSVFSRSGLKKYIENKCSTCTACMSSGRHLKYQLPSTEEIKLPLWTEPGKEVKNDFSGKLLKKQTTGEPNILIGIDRFSEWPAVWVCKSTETK